ncbi:MAG: 2-amino-4-hydroxy-6-hydroxymethyldihydropteridine diphosphokinase [Hyphomicrobium sp.]
MALTDYDAILGFGSNIGDKVANLEQAIALLTTSGDVRLVRRSKVYRTAPWGVTDQDWFANACATFKTNLAPRALLERCQSVEGEMHRVRDMRWGPRNIDVDILAYRNEKICEPDLVIPHPLIAERAFVLIPLQDVAPDFTLTNRTLDQMIAAIDVNDVVAISTESDA